MRKLVSITALYLFSTAAFAQQSSAALEFFGGLTDCAASLGGWKCLELDLSSEVVEDNDSTKFYEYSWNFGDGNTSTIEDPSHLYVSTGSYTVTLTMTNSNGCVATASAVVDLNPAPDAGFQVSNACASSGVSFTNT